MDRNILLQVDLVEAAEGTQEIAQACPKSLNRVVVNLSNAVAVIVSCPFALSGRMAYARVFSIVTPLDRGMHPIRQY